MSASAATCRRTRRPDFGLRQRESIELVTFDGTIQEASTRCDDRHVLFAISPSVSDRCRVSGRTERRRPQLLTRLRAECAKTRIVGCANEDDAAGRRDGAADIRPPCLGDGGGQLIADAERALPRYRAVAHVDGGQ